VQLADELVEDPQCRLVLAGVDPGGLVLVTIWETRMVGEVGVGPASFAMDGVRFRLLTVVDPRNPAGMS